jgi:hypothetical protein
MSQVQGRTAMRFQTLFIGSKYQGEQSMKMKLASLLAVIVLGLAGCGSSDNTSNTTNSTNKSVNTSNTSNKTSSTETKADPNLVKANAEATDEVGGTNEGCKCSAAGMKCSTKPGEKGCCGGKDGACSTMTEGKSDCCKSKGSEGASCCSASGKLAKAGEKMDDKNACNPAAKPATAPAGKKS